MRRDSSFGRWGMAAAFGLAAFFVATTAAAPAWSACRRVAPGTAQRALGEAAPGDTIWLAAGVHHGPLSVDRLITLRGEAGTVVDGAGRGTVITVGSSGAAVEDLEVRGSGRRVITIDSGIQVVRAAGVRVNRVRMRDVLYGIYAERSDSLSVIDCELVGRVAPLDERGEGNGIHLWYSGDAVLRGNHVTRFLDAIYLSFAHRAEVAHSILFANGRYGLHTMYCQQNRLLENQFTHNAAGIAIMFSNGLEVDRNAIVHNRGPRTYGLLLRDCSDGDFRDNRLSDNTVAIFLDGSNRNRFHHNLLQDNGWGVLLFASSAGNVWSVNDFINNDYPVSLDMRRTRNRFDDGARGNYWSDAETYDLDGDGVGDVPHGPVSAFAFVSRQYPDLSVLAKSPAVVALGVAERVFPSLRPSEALDSLPLTRPGGGGARAAAESAGRPKPAWTAFVVFGALCGAGLTGLVRGRR